MTSCRSARTTSDGGAVAVTGGARAASIAERLGDSELAEQYAKAALARGSHELNISRMHALLGRRVALSGGGRAEAIACWQKAAAVAMDGRWHMYALRVGWQCGSNEGRVIADAACDAMGRPMDVLLKEYEDAGAVFEGGDTASAWAHSWATDVAKARQQAAK